MAIPGTAFLALWNDRSEGRDDYEAWHSREHIPERLTIPGILAGRRYVDGKGPLPPYFTFYPLESLDVLSSAEYVDLVNRPSSWSRSMRPALSRMYRQGCQTTFSVGAGVAGYLVAALLGRTAEQAGTPEVGMIARDPAISALHIGTVREIAPLVFAEMANHDLPPSDAIMLVELFDKDAFPASVGRLDDLIERAGYRRLLDWTMYSLAFALDKDEVGSTLPPTPDDCS